MANQFNEEEVVLFNMVLEKFNSDNTIAMQAAKFHQDGQQMQRRGDTVWRPSAMISTLVPGLDITAVIGSVTQLSVPATLSTIDNVPFELDALELRDADYRTRKAESASQALSAGINRLMANTILAYGSLTVDVIGGLSGYDDISLADALMIENDVIGPKTMVLNARDYNTMGGNLASRTLEKRSETALSDTELGRLAGFETFKTSFGPTLAVAAGTATVTGTQRYVPVSTSTAATGETSNVDNRTMNLVVGVSTATMKTGDRFTLNMNSLSHINKNDTGQLKTFVIVAVVDATNLTIAPPIIVGDGTSDAEDDYANVTAAALDTTPLVFLNTATVPTNPFFINDSIEVFGGNLVFTDGENTGVAVSRLMSDSGVEIIFAKGADVKTGKTTYRLTTFYGVTVLNPEMSGILIGNQI